MKAIIVAVIVTLSFTSSVISWSCVPEGPCDRSKCPVLNCKGGVTPAPCGCCDECAKVEGEICGGEFTFNGICDEGLRCRQPEDKIVQPGIIMGFGGDLEQKCRVAYKSCDEACAASFDNQPVGLSTYGRSVYLTPDFDKNGFWGYCDCSSQPWTVIQRRDVNAESFDKTYQQYQDGFGYSTADYWMGLDRIHGFTKGFPYEMKILVKYANNPTISAKGFMSFAIEDAANSYTLNIRAGYGAGSWDFASQHDGMKFSAKDQDNDRWIAGNCAKAYSSGFWFNRCTNSNLNGVMYGTHFSPVPPNVNDDGPDRISWNSCSGPKVQSVEMWIRPIVY